MTFEFIINNELFALSRAMLKYLNSSAYVQIRKGKLPNLRLKWEEF